MIDEVQLGTDALIRAIKAEADARDERGQFLLNGSANFLTVPHITESLAGRAVFLTMLPLSQGEIATTGDGLLDRSFADSANVHALDDPDLTAPQIRRRRHRRHPKRPRE